MQLEGETMRKALCVLFCVVALAIALPAQQQQFQTQQLVNPGDSITVVNNIGATIGSFGYRIDGSPQPTSITLTIQGCTAAASCSTLDTYTTVMNTTRNPTIGSTYAYFTVAGTWAGGGTNIPVSVTVTSTLTVPPNSGGGLSSIAADSLLANATASAAVPIGVAFPTSGTNGCAGATNALIYNTTTHALGCNNIATGSVSLSALTAAAGANTLANGNNPQTWNWAQTTNSQSAMAFGETSAATGGTLGNQYEVKVSTAAGSTAVPLGVINSLSGSQTLPTLHVTPTWNTTGAPDAAILANLTCTAAAANAKGLDVQVGGTQQLALVWTGSNCTTPQLQSLGGIALTGASGAPTTISTTTTNANILLVPNGTGGVQVPAGAANQRGIFFAGGNTGLWGSTTTVNIDLAAASDALQLYAGAVLEVQHIIGTNYIIANALTGGNVVVEGRITTSSGPTVQLGNTTTIDYSSTATGQVGVQIGLGASTGSGQLRFVPTSGTAAFTAVTILPQINQTGGANGTTTDLLISPTLTAVGGTHNFLDMGTGGTGGIFTVSSVGAINAVEGSITTSQPAFNHTATWNAGGTVFTDLLSNITCTAAAANSIAFGLGTGGNAWTFQYNGANCASPVFLSLNTGSATNPNIKGPGTSTGVVFPANGNVCFDGAGNYSVCDVGAGGLQTSLIGFYGFTNATTPTGAQSGTRDLMISRTAAATLSVDDGTRGDEAGLVRWNTCKVSSDITLTVNTNITVCTWSLPAVAKTWAWQCKVPWVISAGSGTNTLSIGVNASQTPTATTTASANIYTTNTGTQTAANVNVAASGAINVLTSPTITPAATVFQSETSGTLAASGTAGTFTITMNAAGTTATAAAKAGATCLLY